MTDGIESQRSGEVGVGKAIGLIIAFALGGISLVSVAITYHYFLGADIPLISIKNEESAQYWGQIGDFFGGVLNPVLSFLALIAVATSLRFQSLELNAARKEAVAAQQLLDKQTKVLEKQQSVLERQNFETTFFGLLQVHERNVQGMSMRFGPEVDRGRGVFNAFANRFHVDRMDFTGLTEEQSSEYLIKYVRKFYESAYGELGHYYRTLQEVFSYLESFGEDSILGSAEGGAGVGANFFEKQKLRWRYAEIVTSSLSGAELDCLYIYCLASEGAALKMYIEKYGVFKSLVPRSNYKLPILQRSYAIGAFSTL